MKKTVRKIAEMIGAEYASGHAEKIVDGVSIDSRQIAEGNLFIPFKGGRADGHQYVEDSLARGAGAAFWQKDVPGAPEDAPLIFVDDTLSAMQKLASAYREEHGAKVIGITGSNGKTTTKDIVSAVIGETFRVHKTAGNYNNHIGLPFTILSMPENAEVAVLEMGMSGRGEISLLTRIARPDVAVITNIGEAHLQDLGSREAIAEAKLEIAEGLADGGTLIYPGAEPLLSGRAGKLEHLNLLTFGESPRFDLYPDDVRITADGSLFTVPGIGGEPFCLPIPGMHNIMNALAALLAAKTCDVPAEDMKKGIKNVKLSSMRMEWREGAKGIRVLNDAYNASPTAMKAVIGLVSDMEPEREKILVLGDMLELGDQEAAFHEEIGKGLDPGKVKYVFTYGPLARHIADGASPQLGEDRVFSFLDKDDLIRRLDEVITGGEIILVKASRGMKLEAVAEAFAKS